ncbi:MAG: PEP-CTERM sorting domain-containing protein [Verrucomicrobiae bacterium]|nr:PEP-CTERM sorting domain-containing protein [Verrucomicrobiae bacterium]
MKRTFVTLSAGMLLAATANAQVYINSVFANPPGADSSASLGNEFFELRGSPNLSLAGYYLLSLEGQGTTGRGDINQFFDLGSFSLGANGFLFAQQFGSLYEPIAVGASVISNSVSQGWGQANTAVGSSVGHSSDGSQLDLENSATTILLVNIGTGDAPTLTLDLDSNDDGLLDLPAEWTVVDSVGIMDGVSAGATDFSYGAVTLRIGGVGASEYGNIVDVPPGTGTGFFVGRIGESTGSTADDWFGARVNGTAADPLAFTFTSASDPRFVNKVITDMNFGGANPVPEPGTLGLLGLGLAALWMIRRRNS